MADWDERRGWRRAQAYSVETLARLVEHHGEHRAAFLAGVPRAMLRRWLDGTRAPPHAAGALLWHLSAFGRPTELIEAENHRRTLQGLAEALQRRVDWLSAELVREARQRPPSSANDPYGGALLDPRAGIHGRPG